MFKRSYLKILNDRVAEPRRFIQVITGPRQVGKTTMVNQMLKKVKIASHFVSADGIVMSNANWIEQQWDLARIKLKQSEQKEFLLVIDEIQKIEDWSNIVKKCWDADTREKRNIKVVLLGSSRLLLQKGLTESLAGRFETIHMGHWSYSEMHDAFGWNENQYVWFGGYPGAADLINDENRWKNYVSNALIETSITKDILMFTRVDKPALMKRLFELGCHYSGSILSFTKMIGQLHDVGNTVTLSYYLDLLDTAGLLTGLEKYAGNKIRQRSSSPKFQVFNTALISAQNVLTFSEARNDSVFWGHVVESSVGAHLLNFAKQGQYNLWYWRQGNNEVDFVIEMKGKIIGLEVKSGMSQKASGMNAFIKETKPYKTFLIGNSGIDWKEFLKMNPVDLFNL